MDSNVVISVRNLVEFILRSGDLDNRQVTGKDTAAMLEGGRIHRKIQSAMGTNYSAEVKLSTTVEYEKLSITVQGRADGIIKEKYLTTIDEIKGTYRDINKLKEPELIHLAQAKCYAYIYALDHGLENMGVQLTYCNMDTEEVKRFKEEISFSELENWFLSVVGEYYKWAEFEYDHKIAMVDSIKPLEFPFKYREGQRELTVSVYRTISREKDLFIQAPTGVGKTMSTVFSAVKALGEGKAEKIFYLTAKTITRTVANEAYTTLRENGLDFKTLTITAKEKICILEKADCNPVCCERAKGHLDRINDAMFDLLTHENVATREVIEEYAAKHNVCPFELSLDVSNWVDGIICDYNYVYDPNVALKRYFANGAAGKYIFLVDEAHNLVDRAREMYSATLYKEQFLDTKQIMTKAVIEFNKKRLISDLEKCNKDMLELRRRCEDYELLDTAGNLLVHLLHLQTELEKLLAEEVQFQGRDEVLDFYFEVCNFINIYERMDEYYQIYTQIDDKNNFKITLLCINPSHNLKDCTNKGVSTIFFSATLLPINHYKELLTGNLEDYAIYINSPFSKENRIIICNQEVTTKYTRRGEAEYEKIFKVIENIVTSHKGNYLIFFPSYKMLESIRNVMYEKCLDVNVDIISQKSGMNEQEKEEFLEKFKEQDHSIVGLCVLGGVFSEGIDLKNESLIGSIIVGTGLPQVCVEREVIKQYFDAQGRNGFDFAYRFPGMNKVQQAAGRVIRTDEDQGVIALLDERFNQWQNKSLFPREWDDVKTLSVEEIPEKLTDFWEKFKKN